MKTARSRPMTTEETAPYSGTWRATALGQAAIGSGSGRGVGAERA